MTVYDVADASPIETAYLRTPYPFAVSNTNAPDENVNPAPLLIPRPLPVTSRPSVVLTFTSIAPPVLIRLAFPEVGVTSALNVLPVSVIPAPAKYVPEPEN